MKKLLATLLLIGACKSGDSPSGPKPVASVTVTPAASSVGIGQTTTIVAVTLDAAGATLTGRSVSWTSSAPAVATTVGGVVTGVSAGSSTITATSEGKSAQAVVTVIAASANCTGVTPVTVGVGEIRTLTGAERQQLCLAPGAGGAEYVLIPFNSSTDDASAAVALQLASTNTVAPTGAASLVASGLAASSSRLPFDQGPEIGGRNSVAASFDHHMREQEIRELGPLFRSAGRRAPLQRSQSLVPGTMSGIRGLPTTPAVGTPIRLNANGTNACTAPTMRGGYVAAVSNSAIVVVDSAAPAGGFSAADFQSIATTFDTLVYLVDTTAFGKPSDIDGNGRVVLFFTTAVNELTPLSSPASAGYVGGFFFARDLFPQVATPTVGACASSNEGEMFYLPVFDPNKVFNVHFADKALLLRQTTGTVAHEFQHLINAGRRLYVTTANVDFEKVWLNEGMSHIAEELVYFRASGLTPKSNLTRAQVTGSQALLDAINTYQVQNLGRLSSYLKSPDTFSPYISNDSLATRGATWQLLRYALDQSPNPPNTYLRALVDAPTQGIPNFNLVFGSQFGNITGAVRQQVIANFVANTPLQLDAKYSFPSWNYRSVLSALSSNGMAYPLKTQSLVDGSSVNFNLAIGGAGYARFRVNASTVAGIKPTVGGSGVAPAAVELILIRTQ